MSLLGKKRGRPITKPHFEEVLKKFLVFLKRELRFSEDIPLILIDDVEFAKKIQAFGEISDKNVIRVSYINRHPVDILRTVAHEYAHYKQHEKGIIGSGRAGSVTENQANAKAGELIRKYANLHPELFEFVSIS